jgi:hypothetical protein
VRATTAFNKMLAVPGAHVVGVTFTAGRHRGRPAPSRASPHLSVWLVGPRRL